MTLRKLRDALVVMGAFLGLIWILQVVNVADGYRLDTDFSIVPQHLSRLPEILTAPFLHVSWQHIEGNSVPLFVLGVLAAYRSIGRFLVMSLIVAVTSGLAVWLFQAPNEATVGASGMIFGYFGYVVVRGLFERNLVDLFVGLVAGALYWTILAVAIPGTPGVSWIDHVGGLVGGVLAAWLLRTRTRGPGQRPPGIARPPRTAAGNPAAGRPGTGRPANRQIAKSVDDLLRELKGEKF